MGPRRVPAEPADQARHRPGHLPPAAHPVAGLQAGAGNAAVGRLLSVQRLDQRLPYVGALGSYLNPLNHLARAVLPGLSPAQKSLLDSIFGNALATSIIRLNPNSVASAGNCYRTTGNIINMPGPTISDRDLVHEAAHVWQHQSDIPFGYAVSALQAQAIAQVVGGDWERAYDYSAMERHHVPWRFWNAEMQAHWIEDHFRLPAAWWLGATALPSMLVPGGSPEVPFN